MDQSSEGSRNRAQPLTPAEAEQASAEGRPEPNPDPPALAADVKTLRWLLRVEKRRLKEAVRIERERRVVFPETSVILRDVHRLLDAIAIREGRLPSRSATAPEPGRFEGGGSGGARPRDEFDDFRNLLE